MKTTIKEVITNSHEWQITKLLQGNNNRIRLDAKRRSPIADGVNSFSEWGNIHYVNQLRIDNGFSLVQDSSVYRR